jgi:hypothetical protein
VRPAAAVRDRAPPEIVPALRSLCLARQDQRRAAQCRAQPAGSEVVSSFLNKCVLQIAEDQDGGKWVLIQDLLYIPDIAQRLITVPTGFQTDLASVAAAAGIPAGW